MTVRFQLNSGCISNVISRKQMSERSTDRVKAAGNFGEGLTNLAEAEV